MLNFLAGGYPWLKAFHVISVIAWMAGMFYLPRLFVYHCQVALSSDQSALFKIMERRLLRAIINPAMISAWVFGLALVAVPGVVEWDSGWFYVKAAALVVLSAFHGILAKWCKVFARDKNQHSEKFFRKVNEIPTVLMIVIVIMVIVKPF